MISRRFTFPSNDGTHEIHAMEWRPAEGLPVHGVIQIIHGMCEYLERYEEFASYLVSHGFIVAIHDQLGHGDTAAHEEEFGFFTKMKSRSSTRVRLGALASATVSDLRTESPGVADVLVADIHRLRLVMQRRYPELPYYMLGHSMGSYLLRKYLAEYDAKDLTGAVIMGTGFVAPSKTRGALGLIKANAALHGWHYRSELIRKIATGGGPYKRYDTYGRDIKNSWLSKNGDNVRAYYANPKSKFIFTLNGYEGLLEAVLASCSKESIGAIPKELPIYLVSGELDPVGDLGAGVRKVYTLYKQAGLKDLSMRLFAGDRHEILNETDRADVYADILSWIEDHMPEKA